MQGPPALTLVLTDFPAWRRAVAALCGLAALIMVAWAQQVHAALPLPAWGAALAASGLVLAAAWRARRLPGGCLRWDGQLWHFGAAGQEPRPGTLRVALDAGAWMLLRFEPEGSPAAWRRTWIPVRRQALRADWHALRCAVYSPRPAPGGSSAAASPTRSE